MISYAIWVIVPTVALLAAIITDGVQHRDQHKKQRDIRIRHFGRYWR